MKKRTGEEKGKGEAEVRVMVSSAQFILVSSRVVEGKIEEEGEAKYLPEQMFVPFQE